MNYSNVTKSFSPVYRILTQPQILSRNCLSYISSFSSFIYNSPFIAEEVKILCSDLFLRCCFCGSQLQNFCFPGISKKLLKACSHFNYLLSSIHLYNNIMLNTQFISYYHRSILFQKHVLKRHIWNIYYLFIVAYV